MNELYTRAIDIVSQHVSDQAVADAIAEQLAYEFPTLSRTDTFVAPPDACSVLCRSQWYRAGPPTPVILGYLPTD